MNRQVFFKLLIIMVILINYLTACGGGGGESDTTNDNVNTDTSTNSSNTGDTTTTNQITEADLQNKLIIYYATITSSSSYLPEYDITLSSDTQYLFRYVPELNHLSVVDENPSPSYASSYINPYTVADKFFIRQEWQWDEYSGYHYIYEHNPLNNNLISQFQVTEPYRYSMGCSAIAGSNYFYRSRYNYDSFYGNTGGEFRRVNIVPSTSTEGQLLFSFGDSNNCFYNLHSDNGLLYDAEYDGSRNIYYYMRNTTTGIPQYLGGLLLEVDHEALYYHTGYSMYIHNGIAYLARRRRADDGIELWSSDFVNVPRLILDIVPDVYLTASSMDIDDGYIAIGSDRNLLVYNLNTDTYDIYYLTGPGTLYGGPQILHVN